MNFPDLSGNCLIVIGQFRPKILWMTKKLEKDFSDSLRNQNTGTCGARNLILHINVVISGLSRRWGDHFKAQRIIGHPGGKIKTKVADEYSGCMTAWVFCLIMGKGDRCAIYGCKNDRWLKDKYVIKPHINSFDGSSKLWFWKCRNGDRYKTLTKLLNWQNLTVNANTSICSNHFTFVRPTDGDPHPTL